jgi:hypothetical protein
MGSETLGKVSRQTASQPLRRNRPELWGASQHSKPAIVPLTGPDGAQSCVCVDLPVLVVSAGSVLLLLWAVIGYLPGTLPVNVMISVAPILCIASRNTWVERYRFRVDVPRLSRVSITYEAARLEIELSPYNYTESGNVPNLCRPPTFSTAPRKALNRRTKAWAQLRGS